MAWTMTVGSRVAWRIAHIFGDSNDVDEYPDWVPAAGTRVTLTPSIRGWIVYTTPGVGTKVTVLIEPVQAVIDENGWLISGDDGQVIIVPTDDPDFSVTGWTWTAAVAGSPRVRFSAPKGGVVELSNFVQAPAVDATQGWVERIPELIEVAENVAGNSVASAASAAHSSMLAEESAVRAETSATDADNSKLEAETSATDADNSKLEAEIAAEDANNSKLEAEIAAEDANNSKLAAETARDSATASKLAAELAAEDANSSKLAAETSATDANNSKLAAETSATNANSSKLAAETARDSATASKNAAATSANNAANSATTAVAARDAITTRTVTGTTRQITVAGTNDAPVLSIPASPLLTEPELVAVTPSPTFGPELAPALSTWTGNGGATFANGVWTLADGQNISIPLVVTNGTMYQIDLIHPYIGAKIDALQLGSVVSGSPDGNNSRTTLVASGSGSQTLTIGGLAWKSTISGVSVRAVTAFASGVISGRVVVRQATSGSVGIGDSDTQRSLTTGGGNTAVGNYSQRSLTTGAGNTAVGYYSQRSLTTGASNTTVGYYSQNSLTTGVYNTAVGNSSQSLLTTGGGNTTVGYSSQSLLTTGGYNTAVGHVAQNSLTTGVYNTAVGVTAQTTPRGVAANATTTASYQTSVGGESGQGSATQSNNITTIGYRAVADGDSATALGAKSAALHAGSVALGSGVTTTSVGQVAIGPRDIEIQNATKGLVLRAPDGSRWRQTITNAGVASWTKL